MNERDVILTGLIRSGTTLSCHLLNRLPDTVALHEPMQVGRFSRYERPHGLVRHIAEYFEQTRKSIRKRGVAISKSIDGQVPSNTTGTDSDAQGRRKGVAKRNEIAIDKPLDRDFMLVIKHPAAFSALLEDLREHFPCFAIVRNPLSILGSWNSVSFQVNDGHIPQAEHLDAALREALAACPDRLDRQFLLLDWWFERFRSALPKERIIRYEDVIASNGRALSVINPLASELRDTLESRNRNVVYDHRLMAELGQRLLASEGPYWSFYSKQDVEEVIAELS